MTDQAALNRLRSHFGNQIDVDVLSSVLAVCGGSADQAIQFLSARDGDVVVDPTKANEDSLPKDYPAQSRASRNPVAAKVTEKSANLDLPTEVIALVNNLKKLFIFEGTFQEHHKAQTTNYDEYTACLLLLLFQGVDLARGSRSRILAACWALKKFSLAEYLLEEWREHFGLPDVLRAVQLLDAPRKKRSLDKKIAALEKTNTQGSAQKKINQIRPQIQDLMREMVDGCAVNGSLCGRVKRWVRTISAEELNFYALQLPKEPWKELADIVHLKPGDFQCEWFLHVTFGAPPPENSVIKLCLDKLDSTNVVEVLEAGHRIPYSYLRTRVRPIPDKAKELVAQYAPLDTLLWFHEELQTAAVDSIIMKRLPLAGKQKVSNVKENTKKYTKKSSSSTSTTTTTTSTATTTATSTSTSTTTNITSKSSNNINVDNINNSPNSTSTSTNKTSTNSNTPTTDSTNISTSTPSTPVSSQDPHVEVDNNIRLSYGKLMERLLYFKRSKAPFYNELIPIAEKRLVSINLLLEPPVAVLGDASYSMDVAIRTATIIASVLTILSDAELKFFNDKTVEPPCYPTTIPQVIEVAEKVMADGQTACASGLWPYFSEKKVVKFFVVVTDEIENSKFKNYYFPDLFLKYYQEVYPAKLVLVSFLENPNSKGRMVKSLENMGLDIIQFRLDGKRPDLTKLDTLLGLLSSESQFFPKQVNQLSEIHKKSGLTGLVTEIQNPTNNNNNNNNKNKNEKVREKGNEKKPRKNIQVEDVPDHYCCPITLSIMRDPVMSPAGHSYERQAINEHIEKNETDPMTGEKLQVGDLRPNRALKEAIDSFCKEAGISLDDD